MPVTINIILRNASNVFDTSFILIVLTKIIIFTRCICYYTDCFLFPH